MAAHFPGRGGPPAAPPWWAWFTAAVVLGVALVAMPVARLGSPGSADQVHWVR